MTHDRATYAERRRAFMSKMERGVAIFRAAPVAVRSHDVEYPYRQDNDLLYLTGFAEPEATCVLAPGTEFPFTLFVRPRDKDKEIWTGLRAGVEGAKNDYRADAAYPIDELAGAAAEARRARARALLRARPRRRASTSA